MATARIDIDIEEADAPRAIDTTTAGRAQNRRVEIHLEY